MGKIYFIMGKSSTGKDTIYKKLLAGDLPLKRLVTYTTRPMREHEKDGEEYHFTDEEGLARLQAEGRIVELRSYDTCYGVWKYFTVDDDSIDLSRDNYLIIGTIESYLKAREYWGKENLVPLLIVLDDGIRLTRALNRERKQEHPRYEEMCRRFLADAKDFSDEAIAAAGIEKSFLNDDLKRVLKEITEYIQWTLK